jgi:hypothetical protein
MPCARCADRTLCVALADTRARIESSIHRAGVPGPIQREALRRWNREAARLNCGITGTGGMVGVGNVDDYV